MPLGTVRFPCVSIYATTGSVRGANVFRVRAPLQIANVVVSRIVIKMHHLVPASWRRSDKRQRNHAMGRDALPHSPTAIVQRVSVVSKFTYGSKYRPSPNSLRSPQLVDHYPVDRTNFTTI